MNADRVCRSIREQLSLFTSRDLTRDEDRRVREHLIGCPACRRELRRWMDAEEAFAAATGSEFPPAGQPCPGPEFFDRLHRNVLEQVAAAPRRRRRRWVGGAAAAAALFVVGWGITASLGSGPSRPRFLDFRPVTDSRSSAVDPDSWWRPVGLSSRSWTGLKGRESADQLIDGSLFEDDRPAATEPVPLRQLPRGGRGGAGAELAGEKR